MNEPAPDAVRLVPVEPTRGMMTAAAQVDWNNEDERASIINMWQSMLAAAPARATARGGDAWEVVRRVANLTVAGGDPLQDPAFANYPAIADLVAKAQAALASQPQATGGAVERETSDAIVRLAAVVAGSKISEVYNSTWCFDEATTFRADLCKALAAIATQPAPSPGGDYQGYVTAFYEIATMLGMQARWASPSEVYEREMRPKLVALIAAAPSIQKGGEG